ncbi:MAG: cation:dicarboxylase symporter family transporter [Methylococcaceae bacterium]
MFSLLFCFSLAAIRRETVAEVVVFINKISQILFSIGETIIKLAPIGASSAMTFTIGKYGVTSLVPLASLMTAFISLVCCLFLWHWESSPDLQVLVSSNLSFILRN